MNEVSPDWQRNPIKPGAPIIPRNEWDLPPYNRWTFQHVSEMTATAPIWRGPGPVLPLPERITEIDGIEYEMAGRRSTIREFLDSSFTDGFLVLSRGEVIAERYMNGLKPHRQHLAMSMTKSIMGSVCGILIHKGLIDTDSPVTRYLPELETTAYHGAIVQQVLDMTTGVAITGPYTKPGTHAYMLQAAAGWRPAESPDDPQTTWQLILRLTEQQRPHGTLFEYRSIESNVLGFIMERASGMPLAELISTELWAPMRAEEDAYITVDHGGFACADGGFNATLRDYARFALLHLRGGELNGKQIVPSEWIEETRRGNHDIFGESKILPKGAYHNQFWIEDSQRRALMCGGNGGQRIYIDPQNDFAAVKLSSWPDGETDRYVEALAAIRAIRDACTARWMAGREHNAVGADIAPRHS
ncbi:MAG: serine hydrolase [Mesorhizobium sp.]|uniref:serine hydrolase domain-containing protein n=1 Tax=Mesorhizobium sp. TaxID=1871066 RepID=UPI00120E4467|nr:serine hydrolase [Mesorhizobium sp.]TIR16152.1 MAG: serine hydrolase [Mesorhizobium sp.]